MGASDRTRMETAEARLERYLRRRADDGEFYCKSKFVAEAVDLSSSQVGVLMGRLQESVDDLEIEQWSYTNATTWRVVERDAVGRADRREVTETDEETDC